MLLAATVAGCAAPATPEQEILALVAEARESAEARDASALKDLVADDYLDPSGRNAGDIRNVIHAWLVAHQSVRLLTRVDSIKLEGAQQARVALTVGMLGRDAQPDSAWDLAGDVWRFDLRLARESDEWRLIRADPRRD